uniref:Uncharacterized protein n=1 Tax=uncultured marine virus TaxID=186617 RepID=A0A0F7L3C7_9VIRU|nr:hypothetical protein [uncultured marine virus]
MQGSLPALMHGHGQPAWCRVSLSCLCFRLKHRSRAARPGATGDGGPKPARKQRDVCP